LHETENTKLAGLYDKLTASQCHLWRKNWFAGYKFYNPSQVFRL